MGLSAIELSQLKTAIQSDPVISGLGNSPDDNFFIARYLNEIAAPPISLWRKDIQVSEIVTAISMPAFVGLSAIKQNGLLLLTQSSVDATSANVRAAFQEIFGAGATLTALVALSQRPATRFEAVFSTAVGGNFVSTMYGKTVDRFTVEAARLS